MTSAGEALVRRLFDEMLNQRRYELAREIFAPDHELHDPQLPAATGPQGMVDALEPFGRNLEGRYELHDVIVDDDRVVARWTGWGEHIGLVQGQLPRGRKVGPVRGIAIYRIADGRIAETWQVHDTLGLLRQMGVLPPA